MGRFATQKKYFLKVPEPKKISGRPDELDIRVQIDWLKDLFIKYNFYKVESVNEGGQKNPKLST